MSPRNKVLIYYFKKYINWISFQTNLFIWLEYLLTTSYFGIICLVAQFYSSKIVIQLRKRILEDTSYMFSQNYMVQQTQYLYLNFQIYLVNKMRKKEFKNIFSEPCSTFDFWCYIFKLCFNCISCHTR